MASIPICARELAPAIFSGVRWLPSSFPRNIRPPLTLSDSQPLKLFTSNFFPAVFPRSPLPPQSFCSVFIRFWWRRAANSAGDQESFDPSMMEVQQQGPASGDDRPVGERVTKKKPVSGQFFWLQNNCAPTRDSFPNSRYFYHWVSIYWWLFPP